MKQEGTVALLQSIVNSNSALIKQISAIPEILGNAKDIMIDDAAMTLLQIQIDYIIKQVEKVHGKLKKIEYNFLLKDQDCLQSVLGEGVTDVICDALYSFSMKMCLHRAYRNQNVSPLAEIFHTLWDDTDRRESLLKNVQRERSGEGFPGSVTAIVWQALANAGGTSLSDAAFPGIDLTPLIDFLVAYVGEAPRRPRVVEEVLALLERDLQGCTKTLERAATIGITLSPPIVAGDVLSWVLCEAKRLEEQAAREPELQETLIVNAMKLRSYQACLSCLGVEHTCLLFQLRDADLYSEANYTQDSESKPRVTATCISGDNRLRVEQINVTPWFKRATEKQLYALYHEGWSNGEVSDSVAVHAALYDQRVRNLLTSVDTGVVTGILCLVNQREQGL